MKKHKLIILAALLACVMLLCGCDNPFDSVVEGLMDQASDQTVEAEATPVPELTAPLFTDADALYKWYNEVEFTDTLSTLTERYGEPEVITTENGDQYQWLMEDGYGFVCAFYNTGSMRAKVLYYEDVRQLGGLELAANLSYVENLDSDTEFKTCVSLFGKPYEIARISAGEDDANDIARVYNWMDAEGSMVQILFDSAGKVQQINYAFAED